MVHFRRGFLITAVLFLSTDPISVLADTKIMTSNTRSSALERDNVSRNLRDANSKVKEERAPVPSILGHITGSSSKKEIDSLHQALIKPEFDAKILDRNGVVVKNSPYFNRFYNEANTISYQMTSDESRIFTILKDKYPGRELAQMLSMGRNKWIPTGIANRLEKAQFESWRGESPPYGQPAEISLGILKVNFAELGKPENEWAREIMERYTTFLYPNGHNPFNSNKNGNIHPIW